MHEPCKTATRGHEGAVQKLPSASNQMVSPRELITWTIAICDDHDDAPLAKNRRYNSVSIDDVRVRMRSISRIAEVRPRRHHGTVESISQLTGQQQNKRTRSSVLTRGRAKCCQSLAPPGFACTTGSTGTLGLPLGPPTET